ENKSPFIVQRALQDWQVEMYDSIIAENDLTGVFVLTMRPRYALDFSASHIVGFVGEAGEEELTDLSAKDLPSDTVVGKSGIEYQYNEFLQGAYSEKIGVAVDERSNQISDNLRLLKGEKRQNMGYDIQLTLNRDYQKFLDGAMAEKNGGAVLIEVATGDILALSSSPGYNQYKGQTESDGSDYVNKAFAYYPPASVFKTVLVLAALEENLNCSGNFYCSGAITLGGGHRVSCWDENGHGYENLKTALGNSCNPYFVQLGQQLGGQTIMDYAYNLGLGEQKVIGYNVNSLENNISFDVRAEADVANVSIGEKGVRLSPLLVAQLMSTIANGGDVITPRLVKGILDADGKYLKEFAEAEPRRVISEESCAKLREFLLGAVTGGTGKPANSSVVQIAGKTGTSQDAGVWFAGYAPADNPRYAIAVYDAGGESGGSDAGVVAKEVFEKIAVLEGFR
ncbi:MAG: peptidoglycan D,D-transpeptidase FtsI family protein, partial [Bacillota bacterium]